MDPPLGSILCLLRVELLHKSAAVGSVVDEETKNSLIQRGRDEARVCFAETIKKTRGFRVSFTLNCVCGCESVAGSKITDPTEPSAPPPYE